MSVEEKVRVEEEQDRDEFMNKTASAGWSMNLEREASNFCAFELYTIMNNSLHNYNSLTLLHIEQS